MYTPSQGLTTHDGYFASGSEPGVPDMVTMLRTPRAAGSPIVPGRAFAGLRPPPGQWVERVAVAVQPGQLHPAGRERGQVVPTGLLRGQQRVDVAVRRRDETTGVDLHRGQAVGLEHLQRLRERPVMQAGGVGAELENHGS